MRDRCGSYEAVPKLPFFVDTILFLPHVPPQVPALLAKDIKKEGGRILLDSPVHLITQEVWIHIVHT